MNLSFKFFLWRIKIKTSKLGAEDKAKFLANELVKSIQDCGYSIQNPSINKQFGSFHVHLHRYGEPGAELDISNGCGSNDWEIRTKPTFKMLEADQAMKN